MVLRFVVCEQLSFFLEEGEILWKQRLHLGGHVSGRTRDVSVHQLGGKVLVVDIGQRVQAWLLVFRIPRIHSRNVGGHLGLLLAPQIVLLVVALLDVVLFANTLAHFFPFLLQLSVLLFAHLFGLLQGEQPFAFLLLELGALLGSRALGATNVGCSRREFIAIDAIMIIIIIIFIIMLVYHYQFDHGNIHSK